MNCNDVVDDNLIEKFKKNVVDEIKIMRSVAIFNSGISLPCLNPEIKCSTCGDKLGWHHANMKWNGKKLVCYGIGCKCEGFAL